MKIIAVFVSIVLFNFVLSDKIYNLTNGTEMEVKSLKSSEKYYFYINIPFLNLASAKLALNDLDFEPFSSIDVYEYESITEDPKDYLSHETLSVNFSKNNNELTADFYYQPKEDESKIIAFIIKPIKDIDYIKIKIDIGYTDFDISNGVIRNITNLKKNVIYQFYTPVKYNRACTINLTFNFVNLENNSDITIYYVEYENRNSTSNLYIDQGEDTIKPIFPSTFYRYEIHNEKTKYLSFEINEKFSDINYILIQMDIEYDIELYKDKKNEINILDYEHTYKCFLHTKPTGFFNIYKFNITLNTESTEPFKYIYIQEYFDKDKVFLKSGNPIVSKTVDKNKLIIKGSYITTDDTNYLVLKLKLNDDKIKKIEINIHVDENVDDLSIIKSYYFYLMPESYSSLIFIKVHSYQSFNLNMNYTSNNSLSSVKIKEYSENISSDFLRETSQNITSTTVNNEFVTSIKYYVKEEYNDTKYIFVEVKPDYNIYNLKSIVEIFEHKNELSSEGMKSNFYDLSSQYKYFVYIPMKNNKRKIKVTLAVNDKYYKPISQITIFELKNNDNINSYEKKMDLDINNIKYISTLIFSHTTSNSDIKTVVLSINPKYDINSMETSFNYLTYLSTGIIALIIILSVIVFAAIIIVIVIFIKKSKGGNSSIEIESSGSQPLYDN